jgi:DNA-binding phage protein
MREESSMVEQLDATERQENSTVSREAGAETLGALREDQLIARVLAKGGSIHDPNATVARLKDDPAALAQWVDIVLRDPDVAGVGVGLTTALRAVGVDTVAQAIGVAPATLDTAFGTGGDPSLSLTLRVLAAMGLQVRVQPQAR